MTSSSPSPSSSGLRLCWHNHGSGLLELTKGLLGQGELADVTLSCTGGINFKAHRLVLAGASVYFRNLFAELDTAGKHPVIYLKDVKANHMDCFLRFIYFGEVSVLEEELQSLVTVAKELKIKGLDGLSGDKDYEDDLEYSYDEQDNTRFQDKRTKSRKKRKAWEENLDSKKAKVKEEQDSVAGEEEAIKEAETCELDQSYDIVENIGDENKIDNDDFIVEDNDSVADDDEKYDKDDPDFQINDEMLDRMLGKRKKPPKIKLGEQTQEANYEIIEGKNKSKLYYFNNFIYIADRIGNKSHHQYMKCHLPAMRRCRGRGILNLATNQMVQTQEHSHPEESEEAIRLSLRARILNEAVRSVDLSLREAFVKVVKETKGREAFVASKIRFESIEKTMLKRRRAFEQEAYNFPG